MKARTALILIGLGSLLALGLTLAQPSGMIGTWKIELSFANGRSHSLRFEAKDSGKGSFLLVDAQAAHWGGIKPSEAKWTQGEGNAVTFSGPVEFPIGNVGRDQGTLVLKGKFEKENLITGEVEFSPLVGEGPSKSGTFKAIRVAGE